MIITWDHITHDNERKLRELSSDNCFNREREEIEKPVTDFEFQ
jgi:hypothetical protein